MTLLSQTRSVSDASSNANWTDQRTWAQILGITCNNASNNDTMIDSLAHHIDTFPGQRNCVCCFAHVVNLMAKCLLKQFDSRVESNGDPDDNDTTSHIWELADRIDLEADLETGSEKDDMEGLIDVLGEMDVYKREIFETDIVLVCTALVKVSCFCFRLGMHLADIVLIDSAALLQDHTL